MMTFKASRLLPSKTAISASVEQTDLNGRL